MSNEEERPRRQHKKFSRVLKLRDEEIHHPLHTPYVRKKEWKKDIVVEGEEGTDADESA